MRDAAGQGTPAGPSGVETLVPRSRAGRALWEWGPAIAMMAAIYFASAIPNLATLPGGMPDYGGHFIGYALLGACMLRATSRASFAQVGLASGVQAWLLSVGYGVFDEIHQRFVPGRTPAIDDLIADALGAAAVIVLAAAAAAGNRAESRGV